VLKIVIDLRMINASGIGTYIQNLIPVIIEKFSNIEFVLLGYVEEMRKYSLVGRGNVTTIDLQAPIYSVVEQIALFNVIPKDTTLFWSPHYNIPLLYRGKLLATVHDVFHLAMPQFVGGIHKRLYAKGMFTALRYKADAVLCVSHFTAAEFGKLVGNNDEESCVIYNGVGESWFKIKKNNNPRNRPYLLYVGNVKPHKNLISLLRAFTSLLSKIPHEIVIVGKKEGFITGDDKITDVADSLNERVLFTGYVDDELLRQYFIHADALVFPSLYEGFGLPPLEAMACGCPVIVSNRASLPEVCGDAALYCDPFNPEDIAQKIKLIIEDENLRETLRQKGLERAKQFTWEKCARETIAVIKKVLSQ